MPTYLFVYGTLRESHDSVGESVGLDRIRGRLYDLGGVPGYYPASPQDTEAWVKGLVLEIDPNILPALDRYENLESGLYTRERVTTEGGREVWVYQVSPRLTPSHRIIRSGDWFQRSNSGFLS